MDNNTTIAQMPQLSLGVTDAEAWIHMAAFYFGGGSVSMLANIFIAVGIAREKSLRSRFYIILFSLVVVRASLAYQCFVIAIYRILRALGLASPVQKRILCYLIHMFLYCSFTVELCLLMVLVIDRMLAIMSPTLYRTLSRRQAVMVCVFMIVGIGFLGILTPSLVGWDFWQDIACVNGWSPTTSWFNDFNQTTDFPLILIVLSFYVILWVYVQLRIRSLSKNTGDNSQASIELKRQTVLLPMLRNVVLTHSAFTILSKILKMCTGLFPTVALRVSLYNGMVNICDLCFNVVVLLASNEELRRASFPMWFGRQGDQHSHAVTKELQVAPSHTDGTKDHGSRMYGNVEIAQL